MSDVNTILQNIENQNTYLQSLQIEDLTNVQQRNYLLPSIVNYSRVFVILVIIYYVMWLCLLGWMGFNSQRVPLMVFSASMGAMGVFAAFPAVFYRFYVATF